MDGIYRFHDTRRAAVTHTVDTGTAAHTAMSISGHRTRSMLDRYSIPLLAEQRSALARASAHVAKRLNERRVVVPIRREP